MSPTVLPLHEFEWTPIPAEDLVLDGRLEIYPWVDNHDYFALRVTSSTTEIQARGWVGTIPLNDRVTLDVSPRVDVEDNLSRFMELSGVTPTYLNEAIRGYRRSGEIYPSLVRLYAEALGRALGELETQGFLKEYQRRESISSTPHGRIMVGATLQRSHARGRTHEATISWFERSVDNPVNQCLLFAVHRLSAYARLYGDSIKKGDLRKVARQLNQCAQLLQGVSLDLSRRFLEDPLVTGAAQLPSLRGYYRPALDVALAIIGGSALSMESVDGGLRLPSLLMSMDDVFESYLRNVVRRAATIEGWGVQVLDGNRSPGSKPLLDGADIIAKPDIVLAAGPRTATTYPIILEVKYKPERTGPKRGDLDQTLAYGVSYRARHVVVLQPRHPEGLAAGLHKIGSLVDMMAWVYVFDMGAEDIIAEENAMTSEIRQLLAA